MTILCSHHFDGKRPFPYWRFFFIFYILTILKEVLMQNVNARQTYSYWSPLQVILEMAMQIKELFWTHGFWTWGVASSLPIEDWSLNFRIWEQQWNEWYPRRLQISLHIRSPGLQDYSEVWNLGGGGGVFWNSWIWTLTIFILGGYSETLGFGLPDNFHLGGYSETLRFGLSDNFHSGGIL